MRNPTIIAAPALERGITRRTLLNGAVGAGSLLCTAASALAAPLLAPAASGACSRAIRSNAWLEIDTEAFLSNIAAYRQLVGPGQSTCVVVKGDAYGNGLALLMPAILGAGLDFLGIASNEEANIARNSGFSGRLMRLRLATLNEIEDGMGLGVEELVGSLASARAAGHVAARRGKALPVHLAFNSGGMSREGVEMDSRGREEALAIARLPGLKLRGLMTHFPVNQMDDVGNGIRRFRSDTEWFAATSEMRSHALERHCANSFAALNVPESRFDFVRVGRCLYGYGGNFPQFRYLASLKSQIASINRYPAGATVSYERTFTLDREAMLANIPIGASDGFRPAFSRGNGAASAGAASAHVVVRGFRAPIVGRVTMNTIMVDVTEFYEKIETGDMVTVFSPDAPDGNRQSDFLEMASTNPPDLMTMFGNSLPKIRRQSDCAREKRS